MNQTERIKAMLLKDRTETPDNLVPAIKSEVYKVLCEYFDMEQPTFEFTVESNPSGGYLLKIQGNARRLYWQSRH